LGNLRLRFAQGRVVTLAEWEIWSVPATGGISEFKTPEEEGVDGKGESLLKRGK